MISRVRNSANLVISLSRTNLVFTIAMAMRKAISCLVSVPSKPLVRPVLVLF